MWKVVSRWSFVRCLGAVWGVAGSTEAAAGMVLVRDEQAGSLWGWRNSGGRGSVLTLSLTLYSGIIIVAAAY